MFLFPIQSDFVICQISNVSKCREIKLIIVRPVRFSDAVIRAVTPFSSHVRPGDRFFNQWRNAISHWTCQGRFVCCTRGCQNSPDYILCTSVVHLDVEDFSEELLRQCLLCHKEPARLIKSTLLEALERKKPPTRDLSVHISQLSLCHKEPARSKQKAPSRRLWMQGAGSL